MPIFRILLTILSELNKMGNDGQQWYRAKRRLCWEININEKKSVFFYCFVSTYCHALLVTGNLRTRKN